MRDVNESRAATLSAQFIQMADVKPRLSTGYLVKGWLSRGALSVLYGPSNAGKTFVVMDIAAHVGAGVPWRGCRINGGPVVYIAAEGGFGVENRLAAISYERPELACSDVHLLPTALDLHGDGDALALCEAMPVTPCLVVVDTLARSMGDGDENTAKDVSRFVQNCDLIRVATQAHVLIVHHSGKDQERGARGSSALRAAVDTEIQVSADREIISRKQRDMPISAPLHFDLKPIVLGQDEDGDDVTSAVVVPATKPKRGPKPLSGQNQVAMQALQDALRDHGEKKPGSNFPSNRKVVHLDHWRAACDAHGLTSGKSESAARTAYNRARDKLIDIDAVRIFNDYVWQVAEDG